jgi:hypothetical protein
MRKKIMLKFFSIIMFLSLNITLKAQCTMKQYPFPMAKKSASGTCDNSIEYAPLIPSHTPIKYIKVDIHVFQMDDGTGNLQNIPAHTFYINDVIKQANAWMGGLEKPNIGTTPYIFDCKVRLVLTHIYYHAHTVDWQWGTPDNRRAMADAMYTKYVTNDFDNLGLTADDKGSNLHLFLEGSTTSNGGEASDFGDKRWIRMGGWYNNYINNAAYGTAGNLRHEIGHSCGLFHNFQGGGSGYQCDDCPDNDGPTDCPLQGSSNNFMDYFPSGATALSQCQMGKMHYYLSGKAGNISDCVVKDYCSLATGEDITITSGQNIFWKSSKNLKGNITIQNGGALSIQCSIAFPQAASITVNTNGILTIDGSSLIPTCNSVTWAGINIQNGGTLILKNTTINNYPISVKNGGVLKITGNLTLSQAGKIDVEPGGYICIDNTVSPVPAINLTDVLSVINLNNQYINCVPSPPCNCAMANTYTTTGLGKINTFSNDQFIQNLLFTAPTYITGNNIIAGTNITNTKAQGPVVIKNGANVVFDTDGNNILERGFEVEKGALFEAK